ncbi:glycoside hydrolase family 15 [Angustibacter sp. McL0619]|uniref:glycoside hydrolase family 15 n=1 Tax=Angustibacter sp. McL0619 TaxID=3415676 RepID=UPI003CF1A7B2
MTGAQLTAGGGRRRRHPRRLVIAVVLLSLSASVLWQALAPGRAESFAPLLTAPSWRVVKDTGSGQHARGPLAEDRWVASGSDPGVGSRWAQMSHWALVDLNQLSGANGSLAAGAARHWSYTWPRDTAFAAAALAQTGHRDQAWQMITFLREVQAPDGGFEARYKPDGSGPPDDRQRQTDGAGWALWGAAQVSSATPDPMARWYALNAQREMVNRAASYLMRLTDQGRMLPPPSPDYWEVPTTRVTLGSAAPVLIGLRSAAQIYGELGMADAQESLSAAADRYQGVVYSQFARRGFQRYVNGGGVDAAITFLMPPFVAHPRADVVQAWRRYQFQAERPAGGLAPGTAWREDGVSWTPEVGLVALNAAAYGDQTRAEHWLDWLDWHRVPWGSLPEKVLGDGSAAGPAPLAWTSSTVLLAVHALRVPAAG